jgi:hypothetical protein
MDGNSGIPISSDHNYYQGSLCLRWIIVEFASFEAHN